MSASSDSFRRALAKGIISGLGWAIGASIGFTIFITFLGGLLSFLDGLPVIGNWVRPLESLIVNQTSPKEKLAPEGR